MSQFFSIHPDNPQARLVRQAVNIIQKGGLVVYPTDSGYALGCQLDDKALLASALERIHRIRQLSDPHNMTLVCRELSEVGTYAKVNNTVFRILKVFTPGPYTFILHGTKEVPRLLLNSKQKTLGLRIPDNVIALALLEAMGGPLVSTTLILPSAEVPLTVPEAIRDILGRQVDLIIDGGNCGAEPTTVVDLTGPHPVILQVGKGDPKPFE